MAVSPWNLFAWIRVWDSQQWQIKQSNKWLHTDIFWYKKMTDFTWWSDYKYILKYYVTYLFMQFFSYGGGKRFGQDSALLLTAGLLSFHLVMWWFRFLFRFQHIFCYLLTLIEGILRTNILKLSRICCSFSCKWYDSNENHLYLYLSNTATPLKHKMIFLQIFQIWDCVKFEGCLKTFFHHCI